jgi:hypothetical protein
MQFIVFDIFASRLNFVIFYNSGGRQLEGLVDIGHHFIISICKPQLVFHANFEAKISLGPQTQTVKDELTTEYRKLTVGETQVYTVIIHKYHRYMSFSQSIRSVILFD